MSEYFVIKNYTSLENQLLDCLEYLPHIPENKGAISPKFVQIILESCSLIESIFKSNAEEDKKYNLEKYSKVLEPTLELEGAISLMLVSPMEFLNPFREWTIRAPEWWNSYNLLKHDRLSNQAEAKMEVAINSMCALHQVMARSLEYIPGQVAAGWYDIYNGDIGELILTRISGAGISENMLPVETKLFVSPNHSNFVTSVNGEPHIDEFCKFSRRINSMIAAHFDFL